MFLTEGDYMKLIYFDESTANDYLKIIQNGKESKQTVETKKNQNQTSLGGKFGIGPMFSKIFESLFSVEGHMGGNLNRTSEKYVEKTLTNAILSDFKNLAENEDIGITKFSEYKLSYVENSIAHFQTISPYLSMVEGDIVLDEEVSININKMHETLKLGKGYYEILAKKNDNECIVRFNNKAFVNNYNLTDLSQMQLTLYGVKVGLIDKNQLNFQNAINSLGFKNEVVTSISEEPVNSSYNNEQSILEMYDIILAGVEVENELKNKIVMGPKSYLNKFLDQSYITLEDYIIKIDSLTRNLVEKFTDNDYEGILKDKIILAKTESYSGITSAALSNFIQIVNKSIEFGKGIILQNPPKSVINQIKNHFGENQYVFCEYEYPKPDLEVLLNIKERLTDQLFGQGYAIKRILASLYKLTKESRKPIVLMLYGPSGVGKTEMSKIISECLGGELFRKQMSMNKTNYMFDYIFGNNHGEPSLARDLLERESNIVLLDEFDKGVNEINSAFYQLFDEGIFEDSQYEVRMSNSIIICTSNFKGEVQIRRELGDPIYYRFDDFIEFSELNKKAKKIILTKILSEEFIKLSDKEKSLLPSEESLLEQYVIKVNQFTNYRHMQKLVENDINLRLISTLMGF